MIDYYYVEIYHSSVHVKHELHNELYKLAIEINGCK
jgi:hypothetical protein